MDEKGIKMNRILLQIALEKKPLDLDESESLDLQAIGVLYSRDRIFKYFMRLAFSSFCAFARTRDTEGFFEIAEKMQELAESGPSDPDETMESLNAKGYKL